MQGESAIVAGPCFGHPVAYAPFPDTSFRDFRTSAHHLAREIHLGELDPARTVFIFAAAKGGMIKNPAETSGAHPDAFPVLDYQAAEIAHLWGMRFMRTIAVSGACASGAIAVEIAGELLYEDSADQVVILGFDILSDFVVSGFHALNALSPDGARPFDKQRDGLSPGEGASIAILSRREPAPGDCIVSGAASSNDANHRTGPSRDGHGLFLAAQAACKTSGIAPERIGGIKCHGTATVYNDAMEAKALTTLFGGKVPPCVSFKGALGHTSGGGSLLEIIIAAELLGTGSLPPTARYQNHGVDEPIPVTRETTPLAGNSLLCLSAGFGGMNAAVMLEKVQ